MTHEQALRKVLTTLQSAAVLADGIASGRSHTPAEDAGLIAARCDVAILTAFEALDILAHDHARQVATAEAREAYAYEDAVNAITRHYFPLFPA